MHRVRTTQLLERERELSLLDQALNEAQRGNGRLVIVRGPAGIGKTALLASCRDLGNDSGMRVLGARAETIERNLPFGVARQLLRRLAEERAAAEELTGAASLSRAPLGIEGGSDRGKADDPFASRHGLYWLTADIADEQPLLLTVDDAQWADVPSLLWLGFLARRVGEHPICLVLAVREEEEVDPSLAAIEAEPAAQAVVPRPLSEDAVATMFADALGEEAVPDLVRTAHGATRGNPLWLSELMRALEIDGSEALGGVASGWQLASASMTRTVLMRMSQLSAGSTELARAVSVLGSDVNPSEAAALAGLGPADADRAARALIRAGVLVDEGGLSFGHPIVREACYADLGSHGRESRHTAAARLLEERGAAPERVAAHLLQIPDGAGRWIVPGLRHAADVAMARGAPDVAATYLRRALIEASGDDRVEILHALGRAEQRCFDFSASEHLLEAYRLAVPGKRARLALDAAFALMTPLRVGDAIALLEETLAETHSGEREACLLLEATIVADRIWLGEAVGVPEELPAGETHGERALLASLSAAQATRAEPIEAALEMARRGWSDGLLAEEEGPDSLPAGFAIGAMMYGDAYEETIAWCTQRRDQARHHATATQYIMSVALRSYTQYRRGDIGEALADARELIAGGKGGTLAVSFVKEQAGSYPHPIAMIYLIDPLIEGGDLDELDSALDAWGLQGDIPPKIGLDSLLERRGKLRIARGDVERGLEDLLEAGRRVDWNPNPAQFGSWRSHAGLALAGLGRREEARELIDEEAELARRVGLPRQIAINQRAAALIAEPTDLRGLEEAANTAASASAKLEEARALTDLGAATRRSGKRVEARRILHHALDLATRCRAPVLSERARQELQATGGRVRRAALSGPESLTPSERRVATMAAEGRSNRQIAQELFLTVRTIEMHLSNAYTKLEIGSRRDLATVLGLRAS